MRNKLGCRHTEGLDEAGVPVAIDRHDCGYVEARNRLIPEAERLAAERSSLGQATYSAAFFAAMDELWRARNAH